MVSVAAHNTSGRHVSVGGTVWARQPPPPRILAKACSLTCSYCAASVQLQIDSDKKHVFSRVHAHMAGHSTRVRRSPTGSHRRWMPTPHSWRYAPGDKTRAHSRGGSQHTKLGGQPSPAGSPKKMDAQLQSVSVAASTTLSVRQSCPDAHVTVSGVPARLLCTVHVCGNHCKRWHRVSAVNLLGLPRRARDDFHRPGMVALPSGRLQR